MKTLVVRSLKSHTYRWIECGMLCKFLQYTFVHFYEWERAFSCSCLVLFSCEEYNSWELSFQLPENLYLTEAMSMLGQCVLTLSFSWTFDMNQALFMYVIPLR